APFANSAVVFSASACADSASAATHAATILALAPIIAALLDLHGDALEPCHDERPVGRVRRRADVSKVRGGRVAVALLLLVHLAEPAIRRGVARVDLEHVAIDRLRARKVRVVRGAARVRRELLGEALLASLARVVLEVVLLVRV